MLADEFEWPGLCPGPDDQFVGLGEALSCVSGIDRERVVLRPTSDDHSGDQPPTAYAVDHCEFLRDPRRWIVKRESVAHHCNAHSGSQAGKDRRNQIRGRHDPVSILVMLVYAHPVKAELLRVQELVDVAVVELPAEFGVVEAVRTGDPRRAVVVRRESRVRHQVKAEYAHCHLAALAHRPGGGDCDIVRR